GCCFEFLFDRMFFFFQAEDGIRDRNVTGVQTCALPISEENKILIGGEQNFSAHAQGDYFFELISSDLKLNLQYNQHESKNRVNGDRKSTRLNSSHVSIS